MPSGVANVRRRWCEWFMGSGVALATVFSLGTLASVSGCSSDEDQKQLAEECAPYAQASNAVQRVPHPTKPTKCHLVLLTCRYCQYRADGSFEKAGSKLCGVCLIREF